MRRVMKWLGWTVGALLLAMLLVYTAIVRGWWGAGSESGAIARQHRPAVQEKVAGKQILFGDLHVHTTFSSDAFLFSLPITMGEGAHPPADACDFARFCSALDFWSINDHAELLTPEQWSETVGSVRQCNEVAGDPDNPDMVSFLGWEWTQMSPQAEDHYGHKNVILRGTEDAEIPTRPISAGQTSMEEGLTRIGPLRVLMALGDLDNLDRYLAFNRFITRASGLAACPAGVDVRDLPADCLEAAPTPDVLFEKLAQWGHDSLVIPHGTSWGIHAPPRSTLSIQLGSGRHDPARQRLFEVYSGHGNSEIYEPFAHAVLDESGEPACPEATPGFTPCCRQAGELIRQRCGDVDASVCDERVESVQRSFVEAGTYPSRFHLVPGATAEEWGECGQLQGGFLPAYTYRPQMSAQFGLALGDFSEDGEPLRFRYGLIGSSDNHKARAGSGYKEFGRKAMSDAWGFEAGVLKALVPSVKRRAEPYALDEVPPAVMLSPERGASFYFTGGLVAVHAQGRDRHSIFDALVRREAYGTSGDRMLLWFDWLAPDGTRVPMGGEVAPSGAPEFEVRAVGAFRQRPGCPDYAVRGLGAERLQHLCLGECFHPAEERKRITHVEVVRILPQTRPDEPVAGLVADPWQVLPCQDQGEGCVVRFRDEEIAGLGREAVYYVRALQEPTPAVAGDPLRCRRDEQGRCVEPRPCYASGEEFDASDECLAPVAERAWSSPIFVAAPPG